MSPSFDVKSFQKDSSIQELTTLERIMLRIAKVLNVVFSFEILFIIVGYVGLFLLQAVTVLWSFWEMFFLVFVLITPYILIITLPSAGYTIFRYLRRSKKRGITFIVVMAAVLNILALLSIYGIQYSAYHQVMKETKNNPPIKKDFIGTTLPNFNFHCITEALPPITLRDLEGKTSVLIFWATYDTPWSSNLRYAQDLYAQKEKRNINIFAVAVDESKEEVKGFLFQRQIKMPIYHDPKSNYNHSLGIYGAEQVLIIDSMNKLQIVLGSPKSYQEIRETIEKVR